MKDNFRKYLDTHSWINFSLNLKDASYKLWLLLGGAESKCKHLAGIPLRPAKQEELNRISLKKGVQATTAIEGNTLPEEYVDKIYSGEDGEIPISFQYQHQEIKNMLEAYNNVTDAIKNGQGCEISLEKLKEDNAAILRNLELKDDIVPGEIRTYSVAVRVSNYLGAPAEDCGYLLQRLFEWLNDDWGLNKEHPIIEGILKAITAHLYVAWIHPFGDGNGRSARILEFRILMNAGIPLTAAHLLTSYYNETRQTYYATLRASSQSDNGAVHFLQYALQGFVDALDRQINDILDEQLNITWENYVHEACFGGKLTPALRRRRDLLLGISLFDKYISVKELRYRLPDEILKQYQAKTKSLSRDLNYLEHEGYIYRTSEGYKAAKDKMKAFLPLRKN